MGEVKTGQIYRHFKGNLYQVVAVARHSENNEEYVVYQALYGDMQVWVRPYSMFVSEVDHDKYPDVTQRYRFELLNTIAGDSAQPQQAVYKREQEPYSSQDTRGQTGTSCGQEKREQTEASHGQEKREQTEASHRQELRERMESPQKQEVQEDKWETKKEWDNTDKNSQTQQNEEQERADERLLTFLDAETCQDKINYLTLIRNNIDDRLINDIAAAMDITIDEGPIDERYYSLKSCLMTKAKYECGRR